MKINRILIANRGEIANRIINTCELMGIRTIVPYIPAEESESFVRNATTAVRVDSASCSNGIHPYLDIKLLTRLAVKAKAQAIHPGYGFLSENPDLPRACSEQGIIFIGPSEKSMRMLGSKANIKDIASRLNIPTVRSLRCKITPDRVDAMLKQARSPLLIKAAAGGGGRGMRLVRRKSEIMQALKGAKEEAKRYFNDPSLIIEEYIEDARHIEVQIAGDGKGNYIHMFERECSIQRRNQKLIEESPAAAVDERLKQDLYKYAIQLAKYAKYSNLGTVEFLVGLDGRCYLQEVNTRLQVEHPVTEMLTGIDMVQLQIEIAMRKPLPKQEDVRRSGHAIECRIVAENPYADFMPSTGVITHLSLPHNHNVRVDTYIKRGTKITPLFDSLLAKFITWGRTRQEAINRMRWYLTNTVIDGVHTSAGLLAQIMNDEDYLNNKITTQFLSHKRFRPDEMALNAALLAAALHRRATTSKRMLASSTLEPISKWKYCALWDV